jgi:hypothetical protein
VLITWLFLGLDRVDGACALLTLTDVRKPMAGERGGVLVVEGGGVLVVAAAPRFATVMVLVGLVLVPVTVKGSFPDVRFS